MIRRLLLDRLILEPSRDPIEPEAGLERHPLSWDRRQAELYCYRQTSGGISGVDTANESSPNGATKLRWPRGLAVIKFPGTAGRCERMGTQPLTQWPEQDGLVVGVNPPGYGSTSRHATLRDSRALNEALEHWLGEHAVGQGRLLIGNSLGCVRALAFANRFPCDAMILRNPPPLPQLLEIFARRRRAAWVGRWLARGLSSDWDAIELASHIRVPTLLVQSELDSLVLTEWQDRIYDRLAGPKRKLVLKKCDHADPIPEDQAGAYRELVEWVVGAGTDY